MALFSTKTFRKIGQHSAFKLRPHMERHVFPLKPLIAYSILFFFNFINTVPFVVTFQSFFFFFVSPESQVRFLF